MMSKAKTPVQRVLRQNRFLLLSPPLLFLLGLLLFFLGPSPLIAAALLVLALLIRYLMIRLSSHRLSRVVRAPLMQDLDLEEYHARLLEMRWDIVSPFDIVIEAFVHGDHQRVLDVAAASLAQESDPGVRLSILSWVALSQFVMGDLSSLELTLDEIESIAAKKRHLSRAMRKTSLTGALRLFTNGNPMLCEEEYRRKQPHLKTAFSRLQWDYFLAATYAQMRDKERATAALTRLIEHPKALPVYAEAAKAQLLATNADIGYEGLARFLCAIPATPPPPVISAQVAKNRHFRNVALLFASFFILAAIGTVVDQRAQEREWQERELIITAEVERAMPGEQTKLLANFDVELDGRVIDEICVLRRENNKILVGSRFMYTDDKDTIHFAPYCTDMRQDTILEKTANFDKSYLVTYLLYRNEADIPEGVHATIEFEWDDDTLYFCVANIKKK